MTTGARSDGWVLDAIDASASGSSVSLTLRFDPLPGQSGGPQAEAWFEASDATYSIAVHGVRGANLVLRPNEVMPLTVAPLRGYYALPVRDDTIFALVVVAARPATAWTLTAADAPGVAAADTGNEVTCRPPRTATARPMPTAHRPSAPSRRTN